MFFFVCGLKGVHWIFNPIKLTPAQVVFVKVCRFPPAKNVTILVKTVAGRGRRASRIPNLLVTNIAADSSMGRYVFSSNGYFKRKPSTYRIPVRGVYNVYIYILYLHMYTFFLSIYININIYIYLFFNVHVLPLSSCNLLHDVCFFLIVGLPLGSIKRKGEESGYHGSMWYTVKRYWQGMFTLSRNTGMDIFCIYVDIYFLSSPFLNKQVHSSLFIRRGFFLFRVCKIFVAHQKSARESFNFLRF